MAPTPRPMSDTILLELTLLSPLKLTDDVLREIKRLARLTTALTILVRTRPAQRSAGAAPTSSERYLDGLDWDEFQAVVVRIYTAATEVYLKENRPLSVVDVLFDSIRNGKELAGSWNGTVIYSQQATTDSASTKELVAGVESEGGEIRGERLFEVTALGGTFDHLHAGHKILLTMAAWITTRRLIVGITDDVLLKNKKFSQHLESLEVRQQAVRRFVNLLKPQLTLDTPPLQDIYGPTSVDPEITAIVVSEETRSGGEAVNKERAKKGLSTLEVFIIKLISSDAEVEDAWEGMTAGDSKRGIEGKMGSTAIREWIEKQSSS